MSSTHKEKSKNTKRLKLAATAGSTISSHNAESEGSREKKRKRKQQCREEKSGELFPHFLTGWRQIVYTNLLTHTHT